jgi:OOP family OmpA-OmpF porin
LKTVFTLAACAAATLIAGAANANDFYVGVSRATPGEAYASFASADVVRNYNSPVALKLFGGAQLSEQFGIEAGYGDFGTWKIANPASAGQQEVRITSSVWYLAGKGSLALNQRFSVFGKLGIAGNRFNRSDSATAATSNFSSLRPMLGFGAEYNITKSVAAVLEYEYFGESSSPTQSYTQQKLELGLKYHF